MAFNRPSLSELITRIRDGIFSRLSFDQLRRSDAEVYGKELAGASHELHGHLQFIAQNVIYDTATSEYLDRWASIWLTTPRLAATPASGNVTITGENGIVIPVDSGFISATGIEYISQADVTISAGTALVALVALTSGSNTNLIAGSLLSLSTPITSVASVATVDASGLTQGADQEDDSKLRARLLARIQQPPHGGADYDYVNWALEVPGVTRAWVYPQELGLGTVTVRFVRDGDVSLIPDAGEVTAVYDYIEALRPVTANLTVVAPVAVPLNFTIAALPNTLSVKTAIETELRDLITREAKPAGTIYLSHIREAISIAAGENNYTMTVPSADVTNTVGNMTTFGAITWS
ncbi:MAG: baseplate J/gp47 family protein [Methylotenera sp.]|nr:baseplate J/gp47 family protein [Methylotenera sp.]